MPIQWKLSYWVSGSVISIPLFSRRCCRCTRPDPAGRSPYPAEIRPNLVPRLAHRRSRALVDYRQPHPGLLVISRSRLRSKHFRLWKPWQADRLVPTSWHWRRIVKSARSGSIMSRIRPPLSIGLWRPLVDGAGVEREGDAVFKSFAGARKKSKACRAADGCILLEQWAPRLLPCNGGRFPKHLLNVSLPHPVWRPADRRQRNFGAECAHAAWVSFVIDG
jgi:hypothetical protein